jgi:hypothetical protein
MHHQRAMPHHIEGRQAEKRKMDGDEVGFVCGQVICHGAAGPPKAAKAPAPLVERLHQAEAALSRIRRAEHQALRLYAGLLKVRCQIMENAIESAGPGIEPVHAEG